MVAGNGEMLYLLQWESNYRRGVTGEIQKGCTWQQIKWFLQNAGNGGKGVSGGGIALMVLEII